MAELFFILWLDKTKLYLWMPYNLILFIYNIFKISFYILFIRYKRIQVLHTIAYTPTDMYLTCQFQKVVLK